MLAYDEKNRLKEFENTNGVRVCDICHKLYKQIRSEQIPGFREREDDCCPYCHSKNGDSMSYSFNNYTIDDDELSNLKRKTLIKTVMRSCHESYKNEECENCNHVNGCPGVCEGNCKNCLEQVHYPGRYINGKKDYDCIRMLQFYVCDYTPKYTSEMLYLMRESEALRYIDEYHVVSIGCGACPDLMAFEKYCHQEKNFKSVSYVGIDVNKKWTSIHETIKEYKTSTLRKTQFFYIDAVTDEYFVIPEANVIVLQYVISHFYNTGQIDKINLFFDKLIDKIIAYKQAGKPFVVLINDVNSNRRGRDYFDIVISKLQGVGFHGNSTRFYFDYNIQNDFQRYGTKHESNNIFFRIPEELKVYQPWEKCSSAQLLIEVWEEDKDDN